ncbi:MAG: TIGR00299 family protein [Denitrovibrio sp.]|nr:MAG: TIGR00299 family protein [Denitrovibrio sp.]
MHADTTLHFDILSGIAGDMSLAILHGLGLNLSEVADIISEMTGKEIKIEPVTVSISGIESFRLKITIPHEHAHRRLGDIKELISKAKLPAEAAKDALGIFSIVAEAEGIVHGKPADEVHFHEVGAIDSILDIVGFAYGKHKLGIKNISSSKPVLGSGFVKCAHGKVPVPAPATLKILEGCEVIRTDEPNELTTPTGAAILKYYIKDFSTAYTGKVLNSAYSTGTMTLKTMPNILRGTLIESAIKNDPVTVIETNIDDSTGEMIGELFSKLNGECIDVFCTSAIGKKNRPSTQVSVLCQRAKVEKIAEILFANSSTAGIRYYNTDRIIMQREFITVKVKGFDVVVKKLTYKGVTKFSPEWDECVSCAKKTGATPMEIYDNAKALAIKTEL